MRRSAAPGSLLLAALALWLAATVPLAAADLYRAELVPVDATAADAVTARAQAIEEGQREGLRQVLLRLTRPEDAGRVPDLGGVDLDRVVRSFEVAEEQVAATRYVARLNINYDPAAIEQLLDRAGLPFVQRSPDPVLIVPAMRRGGEWSLWDYGNPWWEAWNRRGSGGGLLEIALPLGDGEDVATLPPAALAERNLTGLGSLGHRYGAAAAFAAAVELPEGELVPGATLRVELLGPAVESGSASLSAVAGDGTEPVDMLAPVVEATVAALERSWKRDNMVRSGTARTLAVEVPLADLSAWVQIRRDLEALPPVRRVRIDSLERARANLTIDYLGDPRDLENALVRVGLALSQENDRWRLLPAGGRGVMEVPYEAPPPRL
jgi:hypothetical protein